MKRKRFQSLLLPLSIVSFAKIFHFMPVRELLFLKGSYPDLECQQDRRNWILLDSCWFSELQYLKVEKITFIRIVLQTSTPFQPHLFADWGNTDKRVDYRNSQGELFGYSPLQDFEKALLCNESLQDILVYFV
jgi:hypothetical protein